MKTIEEKAKAYDEAIKKAESLYKASEPMSGCNVIIETLFPELAESEDEKIKNSLINLIKMSNEQGGYALHKDEADKMIAWLEKQGKETSWKPSKEEMDVLYGLAYITNQYDEHKEEVITHLYQDLKREFFNGSSYENMFPNTEDGVRRRSTIQVLEYARSLDTYNQYGKADIDKNIAWVEKQGEQKHIDKIEPKFKIGDWIINPKTGNVLQIKNVLLCGNKGNYEFDYSSMPIESVDKHYHLWTIEDAKDGDVLACKDELILFKSYDNKNLCYYCWYNGQTNNFFPKDTHTSRPRLDIIVPATKEQRELLFKKMKEAGYQWDAEKKEPKKIEQKPNDKVEQRFKVKYAGSEYNVLEVKDIAGVTFYGIEDEPNHIDYVKAENCEIISGYAIKENGSPYPTKPAVFSEKKPAAWSEEDEPQKELAESYLAKFDEKFPILPTLKGKQLADYKNFLNKCQQIFRLKYWGIRPIQAKLFEKLSLLWAAWGAEHLQGLGQTDGNMDNDMSMWSEEDEINVYNIIQG